MLSFAAVCALLFCFGCSNETRLERFAKQIRSTADPNALYHSSSNFFVTNVNFGLQPEPQFIRETLGEAPKIVIISSNSLTVAFEWTFENTGVLIFSDIFASPKLKLGPNHYIFWTNNLWFYRAP